MSGAGADLHTREYITLREYVDRRFLDHGEIHASLARQIDKTDVALAEKQALANEFRGTLSDQAKEFATRSEVQAESHAAVVRIAAIERTVYLATGMAIILAFAIPLAFRFVTP